MCTQTDYIQHFKPIVIVMVINMTKQGLALLIVNSALRDCKNHVLRLAMINTLADRNCHPMKFMVGHQTFYVFTIGGVDMHYEDTGDSWFVKLAENHYKDLPSQPLELV